MEHIDTRWILEQPAIRIYTGAHPPGIACGDTGGKPGVRGATAFALHGAESCYAPISEYSVL